jgi:Putative beta-barrel porin 2
MKKFRFFVAAALVAVSWAPAFGQDYRNFRDELNNIATRAKLRIGPLRFLPKLQLQNLGYDDNVYFRRPDEDPVGDYTGTISPEIKGYLLLGRSLILSFTEDPEYLYFARETRLRAFTNSYAPSLRLNLFNRITLSGEYHSQKHLRRAYSEFSRLVTDTTKGSIASFFYETPRGTSIGLSVLIDRFTYEDIVLPDYEVFFSKSLNRKETTGNIELYYPVFSESTFFAKAGSTRYEFEHPASRWRDSRSAQASAGILFPLLGRARGRLSLGFKKFVPDASGRKGYSGLIADTDLNFRFGRFGLRFGLGRDIHFSYQEDLFYYVESRMSPGISLYLTRRFRLDYDFRHGTLKYPEPFRILAPDAGPPEIARRDILRTHSIGLSIFFLRKSGIQISFNIFERTSNVPGFDMNRNFVGLSLTQDF